MTRDRYREPVANIPPDELPERVRRSLDAVLKEWPAGVGVTLFVFDFGHGGGLSYISNAQRADMIRVVREWLDHQARLS